MSSTLQQQFLERKNARENLDRFIPNRSSSNFDYARSMLTGAFKCKVNPEMIKEEYRIRLMEALNVKTRILAFKNKPSAPIQAIPSFLTSPPPLKNTSKPHRHFPQTSDRTLDAPNMADDFYLNLLDWGSTDVLAIALGSTVYLWDATSRSTWELVTVDEENGPVTSLKWAPDGRHIAIGLNDSQVQLWDFFSNRKLRTLTGGHRSSSRVGSLDWNNHILTTGGMDGKIINHDVRVRQHIVEELIGHNQEVCGLKWSASGQQLASSGNDNLIHIWTSSSSSTSNQWLHRLEEHTAAVKALSWCPFQSNLLASGGGLGDGCIKLWNTQTGARLNSYNTGSQVPGLVWNKNERELLSCHGEGSHNQLTLWKYPSMVKVAEMYGHTSRVLYMTQSPDGNTVATAAGDETLRLWKAFGTSEVAKKSLVANANNEPFAKWSRIR